MVWSRIGLIVDQQGIEQRLQVRDIGLVDYVTVWQKMRQFTDARTDSTIDEIWAVEHPSVFTLGQNANREHLLQSTSIPVIQSDRGGQITYHGPGQLVVYVLADIRRKQLGVKSLVNGLEQSIIDFLGNFGIQANRVCTAPGVYVEGSKICSLGLRIRKGCSFHGLAFNVTMDMAPFTLINPCGLPNQAMTQLADLGIALNPKQVLMQWLPYFLGKFGYNDVQFNNEVGWDHE